MRYILATTNKNGKRKVLKRSVDFFGLQVDAKYVDADNVAIYKGNWELCKKIK